MPSSGIAFVELENWVRLLYTYGPFALLVFFVFVAEKKSRTALREADQITKRPVSVVYILNWVAIFSLLAFACYAWYDIYLHRDPTIEALPADSDRAA